MKFWDDVSRTATDAANYTVKKAGEITNAAKVRYRLHLAETKLAMTYEGIGRLYYSAVMEGDDTTEAISDLMADIAEINAEIADCRAQLADFKNRRLCPKCGAEITTDSVYCKKCGTKIGE